MKTVIAILCMFTLLIEFNTFAQKTSKSKAKNSKPQSFSESVNSFDNPLQKANDPANNTEKNDPFQRSVVYTDGRAKGWNELGEPSVEPCCNVWAGHSPFEPYSPADELSKELIDQVTKEKENQ